MPQDLPETTPEYIGHVTIPAGTEARTITSLVGGFQTIVNRLVYFKQQLDKVLVAYRNGVQQLFNVDGLADMTALGPTYRTHRMVCLVGGLGLYTYDAFSALPALGHAVVVPDDAPATGRWLALPVERNAPGAVAGLDGLGRQAGGIAHYATVFANGVQPSSYLNDSTVSAMVPGSAMAVDMLVGDFAFLFVNATFEALNVNAGVHTDTAAYVALPDGTLFQPTAMNARVYGTGPASAAIFNVQLTGFFRATQAGLHVFELRSLLSDAPGAGAIAGFGGGSFFIDVKRP